MTQNPYLNTLKEDDLVWVPLKKGENLPGKIIKTEWKVNGQWVTVEVIYKDMTGKEHQATLSHLRPSALKRRDLPPVSQ